MDEMRLVVLGTDSAPTFAVYNYLQDRFGVSKLILEDPENRATFLKRRLKKLGPMQVAGQLAFQLLVTPALRRFGAARVRAIQDEFELKLNPPEQTKIKHVQSVNSQEALDILRELDPAVIVLAGTRILSKKFLSNLQCPVLNIHAGITPLYRGVHGAYWALAEGRPDLCGVTVHRVDTGIDTGEVLEQRLISVTKLDNFATYPWIQLGEGLAVLAGLLPQVANGTRRGVPPFTTESKLRHHPTIWNYVFCRLHRGVR